MQSGLWFFKVEGSGLVDQQTWMHVLAGTSATLALAVVWLVVQRRGFRRRAREQAVLETRATLLAGQESLQRERTELDRRLMRREELIEARETDLGLRQRAQSESEAQVAGRKAESERVLTTLREELARAAGLGAEEARALLLKRLEDELQEEGARRIAAAQERTQTQIQERTRDILVTAIQRQAISHAVPAITATVPLPSDELKGRLIGREGRNIRCFQAATGVDLVIDDTPGTVLLSTFDPLRREVARRALIKLIEDGRIQPGRIEEVVQQTQAEVTAFTQQVGEEAALSMGVQGLHPKLITLLGRLHFRTSYGQNVLAHAIECARLMAAMAGELKLDVSLAKRCGLLHDIGKAVDHEVEGGHPEVGLDVARRFGEPPEVLNAIAGHHDGVPHQTVYTTLTQVCDAISGGRPGARRESLESYVQRLERLETLVMGFPGVERAYALQAGREVRVIVSPERLNDRQAAKLARDIAQAIEAELVYPGEIQVTLIRETRVTEHAR